MASTPQEFHDRLTEGKQDKLAEILTGLSAEQAAQIAQLLYRSVSITNTVIRAMGETVGKNLFTGPSRAKNQPGPAVPDVSWAEAERKFAGQSAFAYAYYKSFINLRNGMALDQAVFEGCEDENLRQPGDIEKVKAAVQQRLTQQP